jgi:hypothetical protein
LQTGRSVRFVFSVALGSAVVFVQNTRARAAEPTTRKAVAKPETPTLDERMAAAQSIRALIDLGPRQGFSTGIVASQLRAIDAVLAGDINRATTSVSQLPGGADRVQFTILMARMSVELGNADVAVTLLEALPQDDRRRQYAEIVDASDRSGYVEGARAFRQKAGLGTNSQPASADAATRPVPMPSPITISVPRPFVSLIVRRRVFTGCAGRPRRRDEDGRATRYSRFGQGAHAAPGSDADARAVRCGSHRTTIGRPARHSPRGGVYATTDGRGMLQNRTGSSGGRESV